MDSPQHTDTMRRVEALDEPKITQLLLQLVPQAHQDQYNLTMGIIPQNLCSLLETLETIENMTEVSIPRKPKKSGEKPTNGKQKGSFKGDGNPNKRRSRTKSVPSAKNKEVSTQPSILEIVGNMRRTEPLKQGSRKPVIPILSS